MGSLADATFHNHWRMPICARLLPRPALALALAGALAAGCSPTFNWREVPMADGALVALLPCKPDRAERQITLHGSQSVRVSMAGCEAGGATFALAQAAATDAAQAQIWMNAWRKQVYLQWAGARVEESSVVVQRAALDPGPLRLDASRPTPQEGKPGAQVSVVWFASRHRDGTVSLYQATVLGRPSSAEAAETFFAGLHLLP